MRAKSAKPGQSRSEKSAERRGAMTKQLWVGLILGVVVSGIIGGIIGISLVGKEATVEPPDWEAYLANRLKNLRIPEASPPATPIEATDGNLLEGGENYNHHCAVCHDLEGDADSEFAKAFYPPVADLISGHVQGYSDEQLKWIVENGIRYTGMPGWEGLIDEGNQWKIVYYMRALAVPETAEKLEAMLKERGAWKVEAPAAEDHHHAETETGKPAHVHPGHAHEGAREDHG
jgi:mono/diheme cytochrome c family protein